MMNRFLATVEATAKEYGLHLNQKKCKYINMGPPSTLKFGDGTPVKKAKEYEYLGVLLHHTGNIHQEILHRLRMAHVAWKRLEDYWAKSKATRRQKLIIYNAIIKSKVMYGLESAHLTMTWLQKLNTFQLRGLRKILRMVTTFVDRRNTNDEVLRRADEAMGEGKTLELFSEAHDKRRVALAAHLLRRPDDDPGRAATYLPGTAEAIQHPARRVGRPRTKWADATHERAWNMVKEAIGEGNSDPDPQSPWQQGWLQLLAMARETRPA